MNKGVTYLEILIGICVSALIFWLSVNFLSFVLLRDVKDAYTQEFESAKAQVHETLTHEIAWSDRVSLTGENSFSVDGIEYSVSSGNLLKNGKKVQLKNILVESMNVRNLSSSDKLATVEVQVFLKHEKSNSIFDSLDFVVSQRNKTILRQ